MLYGIFVVMAIKKRPAHLSIVERLGGFWCCKGKAFIGIVQGFWKKSAELEVVFNRCWVFRDAKCGICKPKWGIYKPYCAVRRIGCNFAASIWVSARIDCEVDAGFYEVSLHGWWRGINFAASMSAGRTYRYSLSIIHYPFFSCLCMMRAC